MLIINFLLTIVGYATARIVLPVLSLGHIRAQSPSSNENGFNSLGLKRIPGHGLLCRTAVASCIGLVPWIGLVAILFSRARAG